MGGGKGGGGSTTTKVKPWGPSVPYRNEIMQQAQEQYQNGPLQYYPDSTVTPELDTSRDAINALINRGMTGSPVTGAAEQNITDTLEGKFLDPTTNPYWSSLVQGVTNSVTPQVNASFGLAGRTGSGMNQEALAQGLSQGIGQLGANLYGQERGNQLTAAGMAPTIANQDYVDIGNALQGSQQQEGYNQQQLNDLVNRFNFEQQAPGNALNQYANQINAVGSQGGTTTQTQSGGKGKGAGIAGALLTGANTAAKLYGIPTG